MAELIARREARDRYLRFAMEHFDRSRTTYAAFYNGLQRKYDLYRCTFNSRSSAGWNDISVPLLNSVVQSDAARKLKTVLPGNAPIASFTPTGGEDFEKAERMERLVDVQLYDAKTYEKLTRAVMTADLFGTVVWKYSWKQKEGSTVRRLNRGSNSPRVGGNARLRFNGPDWNVIPIEDFGPFPGIIDIADMPVVTYRYVMDFADVVAGTMGPDPIYDAEEVAKLGANPPMPPLADEKAYRRNSAANQIGDETPLMMIGDFSKPVEIVEAWGRVPVEMGTEDRGEFVVEFLVTIANRKYVLNAIPNPHWDRAKPFGAHRPFEDPFYFHAPGKADIVEKLQIAVNRLANSRLDALDLYLSPPILFNENSGFGQRRLFIGPGALLGVNGPVDETQVRQMMIDMKGSALALQEGETIWRWIQQATGAIEDVAQGMESGGSDRQTAREFLGRSEAVSTRLLQETRLLEMQLIEPLANACVEMDRQYLPTPQMIRMIGSHATWSALGRPIAPESVEITDEDLDEDYDIRATGSTRAMQKGAKLMAMQQALQVMAPFPQIQAQVNWNLFIRQWLNELIPNVDQVMNTEQQAAQSMMIGAALQSPAGATRPFASGLAGQMGES